MKGDVGSTFCLIAFEQASSENPQLSSRAEPRSFSAGFSMVAVMVVVGILSLGIIAISPMIFHTRKQNTLFIQLSQINMIQKNLSTLILDGPSWTNTRKAGIATGPSPLGKMDCLSNGQPCTIDGTPGGSPIQNQPFAIYDGANNLFYDATNSSNGFDASGVACNTFSSSGNYNCPFRFDLRWTAICTGSCIYPMIKVNAVLLNPIQIIINTTNYSVSDIIRSGQ